jgi:hypothetical protein
MNTSTNIMGNYAMFGEDRPNNWLLEGRPHDAETFWLQINCRTDEDEVTTTLFFERLTTAEVDAFVESSHEAIASLVEWNKVRKVAESEDAES